MLDIKETGPRSSQWECASQSASNAEGRRRETIEIRRRGEMSPGKQIAQMGCYCIYIHACGDSVQGGRQFAVTLVSGAGCDVGMYVQTRSKARTDYRQHDMRYVSVRDGIWGIQQKKASVLSPRQPALRAA